MTTITQRKYAGKKHASHTNNNRTAKRMICSPAVRKISVKNSCYTPKILAMIRDAYNRDHSREDAIEETDPTKLWQILNSRFVQCKKEDCWLNELKDANLKNRLIDIFLRRTNRMNGKRTRMNGCRTSIL